MQCPSCTQSPSLLAQQDTAHSIVHTLIETLVQKYQQTCDSVGTFVTDCVNLHQVLVEQLLQRVWDKGDIYKAKYEGEDTRKHSINNVYMNFVIVTMQTVLCAKLP